MSKLTTLYRKAALFGELTYLILENRASHPPHWKLQVPSMEATANAAEDGWSKLTNVVWSTSYPSLSGKVIPFLVLPPSIENESLVTNLLIKLMHLYLD